MVSDKKGKAAEDGLRLTRRELVHIKLVLYSSANRAPTNTRLTASGTSLFNLTERALIEDSAKAKGVSKDGERVRFLNVQLTDALLTIDFEPKGAAKPLGSEVQTSGQWSSSVTETSCELQASAIVLSDNLVHITPNFRANSLLTETDSRMPWDMINPSPFDSKQPVSASIDGRQFDVDVSDGLIRPALWNGGPSRDSAIVSAMKLGSNLSFQGTNTHTGEPLTVTYSLDGFTVGFQRMAKLCNRPALLGWIR